MRSWRLYILVGLVACQDYPFETRLPQRVQGRKIGEVVAQLRPVDILFVVDNSGTMSEEREELRANVGVFVDELLQTSVDFQIGIITPDVECNVPERDCGTSGTTSLACCALDPPPCADLDINDDGVFDQTTCDAGRLRSANGLDRIFTRPSDAERDAWVTAFSDTITALGCEGSSFESGLEASVRAVACAVDDSSCPDPRVADLNAGFIREGADLVIIFLTDEDDCSFREPSYYERPPNPSDPGDQAFHLCSPNECYAHYGQDIDTDQDGIMDWADSTAGSSNFFLCQNPSTSLFVNRMANPPLPDSPNIFLQELFRLKNDDIARVRAAGILSGFVVTDDGIGFRSGACWQTPAGPSEECGCLSSSSSRLFCQLTALSRDGSNIPEDTALPEPPEGAVLCGTGSPLLSGCEAMPTGRYVEFLSLLAQERDEAGLAKDVLADTICQPRYDDTLFRIVNNVILSKCFDLGQSVENASDIDVRLNGQSLANVAEGSEDPGWSLRGREICLEGGLVKNINDEFEIFVVSNVAGAQ